MLRWYTHRLTSAFVVSWRKSVKQRSDGIAFKRTFQEIIMKLFVSIIFLSISHLIVSIPEPGNPNVCSTTVSKLHSRKVSYPVSYKTQGKTKCGLFRWFRCTTYSRRYGMKYRREYYKVYSTNYFCCNGWAEHDKLEGCPIPLCTDTNRCSAHGVCVSPNTCRCNSGFDGQRCDHNINECLVNKGGCQHRCIDTVGSYYCQCFTGYIQRDKICEVNECLNNNGGCEHLCNKIVGGFQCDCSPGFELTGSTECLPICKPPCKNNGQCVAPSECNCPDTYRGSRCEVDVNECSVDNGGCDHLCENLPGTFICSCLDGYSGTMDCTDIDECSIANCHRCINLPGSFECQCQTGYEVYDLYNCRDIDECAVGIDGCAHDCSNSVGSFSCDCNRGWTLKSDKKGCIANQCIRMSRPFNGKRTCTGFTTGETCVLQCDSNFRLSGSHTRECLSSGLWSGQIAQCKDVNECLVNNGYCDHLCENLPGTFRCSCFEGFSGTMDCIDVDECTVGTDGCAQQCSNSIGSFSCDCKQGWTLDEDRKSCTDVDECAVGIDGCAQTCSNSVGSFSCDCNRGWTLNSDKIGCTDVDECTVGTDGCAQQCSNSIGSFSCDCKQGWTLDEDNKGCTDVDECAVGTDGCAQNCSNSVGSFSCGCKQGWTLDADKKGCTDVDECAVNLHVCAQQCYNSIGSFSCDCKYGWTLDTDKIECTEIICPEITTPVNGYIYFPCENKVGSRCRFGCDSGYFSDKLAVVTECLNSGKWNNTVPICIEIQPCLPSPCANGVCLVSQTERDGYTCDCSGTGYAGKKCTEGLVTTPDWPDIWKGEIYELEFSALPKQSLQLIIETDSDRLLVEPNRLYFTAKINTVTVSIQGVSRGPVNVEYVLSGKNAADFITPDKDEIFVLKNESQKNFPPTYLLPSGCCAIMVSDQPTNTDLEYVSTKKWEATNDGMTTNGIVSIKTETFELPLRLDGQTVARGATTLTRIDNYKSKDTKKYDIQNFVKFNSLYRNYTRQLENVLPDWITFISVHIDPMDAKTSTSSLSLRGTEVKSIEWCSAAPVQDNGQYSVFLLYKTQLTVGGRRITLPLPPFKGKYCFIVGVSKITSGEVMVVFPEGSRDVLSYIDDINDEPSLDANVNFLAFVKSDRSGNKGDNIKIITNLQYSYYINKTISAKLKGGGDVHISLDNGKQLFSHLFIQRWVLQQFGNSKISLFWKVFGEDLKLNFSSNQENTPILNADIGDFVADKHVSQRGIVMKAPSSTDAFDNTPFSRLLKKIKGPIEVFVDYDLYPHNILQSNLDSMTETIRDLKRIVPQIKSLAKQLEASGYDGIYIDINSAVDILKENTRYYLLSDLHDLKTIGDSVNAIRIQCKRVLNILWNFDDEMSNLDIQNIDLKTDLQNVTTHFENLGNQILIEVQNIFVEESVSRSGFRMTSQLCLPSSLCFPSTKIEALYSISSCSKLHNQSISNNIDSNLPRVCITGDYLMTKNLNLFISIPFGSHFEVVFDSSKKYWFGGIQVEINLLGIQGVTTMYLATAQIHFTFSGKLWGLFDTSGNATSELSSFESMGLSVNGQVAAEGPLSLGRRLKDKIISFSQKSVDDSERRLSRASKSVETIKSKLQKALDEEVIQKSTVANAKKKHISAAEEVVVANIAVEKARELLGYTRGSMKETMATHLNKVCEIAECRVVCLPSSKIVVVKDKFLSTIPIPKKCCDKTVEDTIVDTKTSYCTTCWESTPVSHVSINPFVAAAGFALLFIHPLLGYPLLVSSIKKGKRDSYSISECCEFGMETVKIPVEFTLCSTCVSYKTITGQKDKLQLEEVPCNAQIPNSECVMQNEECRKTRNQLIDKLMGKESELASLIHQFENAGKRASVARAMLNEAQIELDDALNKQKELSYQVITLKKILQNAQDAFNKISSDVKTGLKIKEHQINGSIEESLKIKELQLNIELVGEDTFVIPIVCYMTLLSTPVNVQIIIDKNNLENTIENAAFFITEELFGNLNNIRRRRDTRHVELQTKRDTEAIIVQPPLKLVRYEVVNKSLDLNITSSLIRDPNVVQNEERCADYENILSFVEYSFLTLLEIVNSSEPANTLENEKKFQNDYLYNLSVSTPPIDVNSAALLYFNLTTIDTIAYQVDTVERDALTKMINSAKVKSKNTKLLLEIDALNQWEIEMDTYTQHCSGLVNCQGFFDCLTTEMVALKYLAEGRRSYEDIVSLDEYVSTFIDRNTNSNETETIATNVLSQVSFLKKNNDVCLEEPIITKHPEPKIITVKGEDVTLTCQATGNPSPTFTWERNGQILSGKNLNYLLLKTVKVSDSGRYTCHAHNAVTSISSLQCDVSVEFAPRITEYPQSEDIEYGNIEGAYFTCQASALPLAHYQWYFQGLYSLERKLIPGQNGSSIEILSPDFNQDGWYTCEAWNKHGGQISNTARLHVLDISMPEFSGDVTIRFYRVPNFKSTNVSLEDVIARVVSNTDPEVELLNYQEFNMKDKSFIKQISFEIKSTNATSIDILKASRNESAYQVKDKIETVVAKVTELKGLLTLGEHYEYRGELLEVIGFNSEWNGPICPNTQYAHKDGYVCVNCPPGSYRGNDSLPAVCLKCPTGFYQPNEGQTTCMECHGYTNADVGGRACTQYPTYPCSPCEKEKGTSYIPYAVGAGGGFVCFLFVVTVSRSLVKYN